MKLLRFGNWNEFDPLSVAHALANGFVPRAIGGVDAQRDPTFSSKRFAACRNHQVLERLVLYPANNRARSTVRSFLLPDDTENGSFSTS